MFLIKVLLAIKLLYMEYLLVFILSNQPQLKQFLELLKLQQGLELTLLMGYLL